MKLNNKGFALTSIIYMLIVLFLMILLLVLSNLASRKVILDKMKYDVKEKLNQGGYNINQLDRPYVNLTTGLYYETLSDAFNGAEDNKQNTIKVLKSIKETVTPLISTNKNIILDMNNQTISLEGIYIDNDGTLNIKGKGTIESTVSAIRNDGLLTTEKEIFIHGIGTGNNTALNNFGTMTLTDTLVTSDNYRAIYNQTTGIMTVNGNKTEIKAKAFAIYNGNKTATTTDNPAVTITAGTFESTNNNTIYNNGEGMIYLTGGHIIQQTANSTINNKVGGIIEVAGATIEHKSIDGNAITSVGGKVNVSSGTITTTGGIKQGEEDPDNSVKRRAIVSSGDITISGGNIKSEYSEAVSVYSTGNASITGGEIEKTVDTNGNPHDGAAVSNAGTGIIEITGGTIKVENGNSKTVHNDSTGTINISGGTITNSVNHAVYNKAEGTITISGENTNINQTGVKVAVYNNGAGTININGGNITAAGAAAVRNYNASGTVNITGGNITVEATSKPTGAETNLDVVGNYGTLNISGGTLISNGGAGISAAKKSTTTVTGGTIIGKTYGIWGTNSAHAEGEVTALTVGTSGGGVNTQSPIIVGKSTAGILVNNITVNFYDGIVYGPTNKSYEAINGTVTPETGYQIITGTGTYNGTTYKTATLGN